MSEIRNPESGTVELTDAVGRLARALKRRRRALLVVSATTFVAIQAMAFLRPGTYAAKAAILVQQNRLSTRLNAASEPIVMTAGVSEEQVSSEIAVLTSHEVLAATVASTGLDQARPPPRVVRALFYPLRAYEGLYARFHGVPERSLTDRAIQGLANRLSANRLKDSNVLVLTFEANDPRVAEAVLDQLITHYLDHHLKVHGPQEVGHFFTSQAHFLEQELERHEDELQALKRELGTTDVVAETNVQLELDALLRQESTELDRRLGELDGRMAGLESTLAEATKSAASGGDVPLSDPILPQLKGEILDLELEQIRLDTHYQPDFPPVVENRRKLEIARQTLEEERHNVFEHSPTLLVVDRDLTSLAAERVGVLERRGILEAQLEASRARVLELDRKAIEATRAWRLIRATEEQYLKYLARFEDARIDAALDQSRFANVSLVQGAVASAKPVRPKKLMVLAASLVGGLLAGFMICVLLELKSLGLAGILASVLPRAEKP